MSVNRRTIIPLTGNTNVSSPALTGVRILMVSRSGDIHTDVTPATPGNHEFRYAGSRLYFDTSSPFNLGEKVIVIFET